MKFAKKVHNFIKKFRWTIVLSLILGLVTAVQASATTNYYPKGPQRNVSNEKIVSAGWHLCFEDTFGNTLTSVDDMLENCSSKYILIAGKLDKFSDNIDLLAAGERSSVFKVQNKFNETSFNNGTYFYFYPDYVPGPVDGEFETGSNSIGFSKSNFTYNWTCDIADRDKGGSNGEYRLCRHINEDRQFSRGFRIGKIGLNDELNEDGSGAAFLVYEASSVPNNDANSQAILIAQQQAKMEEAKSLAVIALGIASVSDSLSKLTASLLPKKICIKKNNSKVKKKVTALQNCPKNYVLKR